MICPFFVVLFLFLALILFHSLPQAAQLKNQILLAQRGNVAPSTSSASRPAPAASSSSAPPASRGSAGGAKGGGKGGARGRAAVESDDEVDLEGSDLGSEDMDEEDVGDYVMFSGGEGEEDDDEDEEDPYSTGA